MIIISNYTLEKLYYIRIYTINNNILMLYQPENHVNVNLPSEQ